MERTIAKLNDALIAITADQQGMTGDDLLTSLKAVKSVVRAIELVSKVSKVDEPTPPPEKEPEPEPETSEVETTETEETNEPETEETNVVEAEVVEKSDIDRWRESQQTVLQLTEGLDIRDRLVVAYDDRNAKGGYKTGVVRFDDLYKADWTIGKESNCNHEDMGVYATFNLHNGRKLRLGVMRTDTGYTRLTVDGNYPSRLYIAKHKGKTCIGIDTGSSIPKCLIPPRSCRDKINYIPQESAVMFEKAFIGVL